MTTTEQPQARACTWDMPQKEVLRYAGVARDLNDIHWSGEAATDAGFQRPIVHGMFALGRLLVELERVVGVGRISQVAVRFERPAPVGSQLSPVLTPSPDGGYDIGVVDSSGTATLSGHACTEKAPGSLRSEAPRGDLVAERTFLVERGPAARLADVLGADDPVYADRAVARSAGWSDVPTVPSFGFVLPAWGFFTDLPGNAGQSPPDVVAECQQWCGTLQPVVHATQGFTFTRPILVGDLLQSRTRVVGRRVVESRGRRLHFTDVSTELKDEHDRHVLTSDMGLVVIEAADSEETR